MGYSIWFGQVTDDGQDYLMDRDYIDMHLLIDRYLLGGLAEDEKAQFEERLVWDQELIDELDLAECLRDGLRKSVSEDRYSVTKLNPGVAGWLSDVLAVPQYAAAASFLLAVTLTVGVLLNPLMTGSGDRGIDAPHFDIVQMIVVRGASVQQVPFDDEAITVLLVDAVADYESYRVTVHRDSADGELVWMQEDLLPHFQESVAVSIPGKLLSTGRYVLTLEGIRIAETGARTFGHVSDITFDALFED